MAIAINLKVKIRSSHNNYLTLSLQLNLIHNDF